jgi:hypothetical protein
MPWRVVAEGATARARDEAIIGHERQSRLTVPRRLLPLLLLSCAIVAAPAALACCRNYQEFADMCRAQGGTPTPNPPVCHPQSGSSGDDGAAARQAEAERARLEQERLAREEAERRARFERGRAAAVAELKRPGTEAAAASAPSNPHGLKGTAAASGLKRSTVTVPVAGGTATIDAFTLGFEDASGCISQSTGARCSAVPRDRAQACFDDYRDGYSAGEVARKLKLDEALKVGQADGAAGRPANGAARPEADGGCRIEWIEAYNRGWFERKPRLAPGKEGK